MALYKLATNLCTELAQKDIRTSFVNTSNALFGSAGHRLERPCNTGSSRFSGGNAPQRSEEGIDRFKLCTVTRRPRKSPLESPVSA